MKAVSAVKGLSVLALSLLGLAPVIAAADFDRGHPPASHYGAPGPATHHGNPYFDRHDHPANFDPVDQRQARQRERIESGIERGQITRHEALQLAREQREIEAMQRRFLADRHLSRGELETLDRALDNASRHILREARDDNRRGW